MLHPAIVVRNKGAIEGCGLFASSPIPKGMVVWQLDEPTFTSAEIKTWRGKRLADFKRYGFQCGEDRFSLPLGHSREMNHACNPNTWWDGSDTIIARRDIVVDEEITYDYSSCDIDLEFSMSCCCGFSDCRRRISNRDYLDLRWQQQYGLNLPPHVLAAIDKSKSA